jgi:hypothetical protein
MEMGENLLALTLLNRSMASADFFAGAAGDERG